MIRTIVTPDEDRITLSIPQNYIGVEIEVIAFIKEEMIHQKTAPEKVTFDSLSIDTRGFKFDREEANER